MRCPLELGGKVNPHAFAGNLALCSLFTQLVVKESCLSDSGVGCCLMPTNRRSFLSGPSLPPYAYRLMCKVFSGFWFNLYGFLYILFRVLRCIASMLLIFMGDLLARLVEIIPIRYPQPF